MWHDYNMNDYESMILLLLIIISLNKVQSSPASYGY